MIGRRGQGGLRVWRQDLRCVCRCEVQEVKKEAETLGHYAFSILGLPLIIVERQGPLSTIFLRGAGLRSVVQHENSGVAGGVLHCKDWRVCHHIQPGHFSTKSPPKCPPDGCRGNQATSLHEKDFSDNGFQYPESTESRAPSIQLRWLIQDLHFF